MDASPYRICGSLVLLGVALAARPALAASDACALLSATQVHAILDQTLAGDLAPGRHTACTWSQPGATSLSAKRIVLTLLSTQAFQSGKAAVGNAHQHPVPDIGDEAYESTLAPFGGSLSVRRGAACFQVRVVGFSASRDRVLERLLARTIVLRLKAPAGG